MKTKICEFCNKGEMVLIQDRLGIKGTDDRVGWRNKIWKCCNCKSQIREEIYDEINQQILLDSVIRSFGDLTKDSLKTLKNHIDHHLKFSLVKCIDVSGAGGIYDEEKLKEGKYYKILEFKTCSCRKKLVKIDINIKRDWTHCECGEEIKGVWFAKRRFECLS